MLTTFYRDAILGTMDGATLTAFTPYVGLLKGITDFRAGTVTEAAYTGYGTRPSCSFGAAGNTTPTGGRQKANDGAVTFPLNTGANEDQIGFGIYDAATAGNLYAIGFLDADPPIMGVGNVDDTITAYAHGLEADQRVFVLAAPGAVIPTGLAENTAYYVLSSGLTADVFKLSTSSGGAAENITVGGASLFMPYKAVTVATGATPEFAIGTLIVQL
ncbi:MAG: hypothetical protein OEW44_02350 [Gemmatimonadota bacterium]|nr:hypothetical protein [Gemmatimonadota bacterium]